MTPLGQHTIQQIADARPAANGKASRWIENGLAVVGILLGAVYVVGVEVYPHVCYSAALCTNPPQPHEFPWIVALVIAACVAPKTIGRASAGRVWEAIAARFGSKPGG